MDSKSLIRTLPAAALLRVRGLGRWVARCLRSASYAVLLVPVTSVFAAELIVVDQDNCPYCVRFEREIAPAWPNTDEGRDLPLRRVDIHDEWPADLAAVEKATLTPTFILVEDGVEQGRLIGYAGDEHFWFLIAEMLDDAAANASLTASPVTADAVEPESSEQ